MRMPELEFKVQQAIEQVEAGNLVEDQRIELKRIFLLDDRKAARQLAGLANACRGNEVVWIIGLDEEKGVVDIDKEELANWWPKVKKHFCSPAPVLETNCVVTHNGKPVVGLCFRTDNLPYLITNPNGGQISREVPWREGNRTRTAKRSDLLKVLVPQMDLPVLEPVHAVVDCTWNQRETKLAVILNTFVYTSDKTYATIPFHRNILMLRDTVTGHHFELPIYPDKTNMKKLNNDLFGNLVQHNRNEVNITGSGVMILQAEKKGLSRIQLQELANHPLEVSCSLFAFNLEAPLKASIELPTMEVDTPHQLQWRIGKAM